MNEYLRAVEALDITVITLFIPSWSLADWMDRYTRVIPGLASTRFTQ